MSIPTDKILYNRVKLKIFTKNSINSAYRSASVVKEYKKEFVKHHGIFKNPYITKIPTQTQGLNRWFLEDWTNQTGKHGYQKTGDIYRPNIRINKQTPKTFEELSQKQIKKAMKTKRTTGRVNKF